MSVPALLVTVAQTLGALNERVVFVGGMIRSLLITDPAFRGARPTEDVDLIIDVRTSSEYRDLETELRERGFSEHIEEGAPVCRWKVSGVRVDVMPVDPLILGFSNVWYVGAHVSAIAIPTGGATLRILDGPHSQV